MRSFDGSQSSGFPQSRVMRLMRGRTLSATAVYARFLPQDVARIKQQYDDVQYRCTIRLRKTVLHHRRMHGVVNLFISGCAKLLFEDVILHCAYTIQQLVGHNLMLCEKRFVCMLSTKPACRRLSSDSRWSLTQTKCPRGRHDISSHDLPN